MRYLGGKNWIADQLAGAILPQSKGRRILEPFCGGLSMTAALQPAVASDASEPLIRLIQAVRSGWTPPDHVSEDDYNAVKSGHHDIMWCYVGLCCTWGGKWWGGYTRSHERQRDPTGAAKRRLIKLIEATQDTEFVHQSYEQLHVQYGDVVYCDPPYLGTTFGYASSPQFSHENFWEWVRWIASHGALVFVSEFTAPGDIECCMELPRKTNVRAAKDCGIAVDKLYRIGD